MRRGFTLVELLVVVLIVALLAGIALPMYKQVVLRARAASVVGTMNAVRLAAYEYNADTGEWPADLGPGQRPPELEPYLGDSYLFEGDGYQLDWENWELPGGTPKHPETGVLLGISMTTTNETLGAALENLLGSNTAHYTLGDNYTFIIAAM